MSFLSVYCRKGPSRYYSSTFYFVAIAADSKWGLKQTLFETWLWPSMNTERDIPSLVYSGCFSSGLANYKVIQITCGHSCIIAMLLVYHGAQSKASSSSLAFRKSSDIVPIQHDYCRPMKGLFAIATAGRSLQNGPSDTLHHVVSLSVANTPPSFNSHVLLSFIQNWSNSTRFPWTECNYDSSQIRSRICVAEVESLLGRLTVF